MGNDTEESPQDELLKAPQSRGVGKRGRGVRFHSGLAGSFRLLCSGGRGVVIRADDTGERRVVPLDSLIRTSGTFCLAKRHCLLWTQPGSRRLADESSDVSRRKIGLPPCCAQGHNRGWHRIRRKHRWADESMPSGEQGKQGRGCCRWGEQQVEIDTFMESLLSSQSNSGGVFLQRQRSVTRGINKEKPSGAPLFRSAVLEGSRGHRRWDSSKEGELHSLWTFWVPASPFPGCPSGIP